MSSSCCGCRAHRPSQWKLIVSSSTLGDECETDLASPAVGTHAFRSIGRAAFVEFFSKVAKPKAVESKIKAPLVAIVGDGDLVILAFAREGSDPKDSSRKYTTTWFDMFRIENGKIAEHWDPAIKQ